MSAPTPLPDSMSFLSYPDGSQGGADPTPPRWPWRRWRSAWRRWSLWTALVLLVVSMLATMVWLAGRYEASQVQTRLERDTADAVSDIRVALNRNLQSLQALHAGDPGQLAWDVEASELLRTNRELVRIEWREPSMRLRSWGRFASIAGMRPNALTACSSGRCRNVGVLRR